jgi:hypothetical protein
MFRNDINELNLRALVVVLMTSPDGPSVLPGTATKRFRVFRFFRGCSSLQHPDAL